MDGEVSQRIDELYQKVADEESDRDIAIFGTTRLEELLQQMILGFLVDDDKAAKLLKKGPLRTFHARIAAAYSMGLISKDEYDDLMRIKAIRNRFAHTGDVNSLLDEDVAQQCSQLSPWKTEGQQLNLDPLYLFTIAVVLLLRRLEMRSLSAEQDRRSVPSEIAPEIALKDYEP